MKDIIKNISLNSLVPDDNYYSFIVFKEGDFIPIQKTLGVFIFNNKAKFLFEIFLSDINKNIHKSLDNNDFLVADIFIPAKEEKEGFIGVIMPSKIKKSKTKESSDFLYYISAESDLKNIKIEDNFIDIIVCDKIIKKFKKEKQILNLDLDY